MNREELAEHLASVFLQSSVKWPEIGTHAQAMWLAVADAALSALKGPRTGEELYNAIGSSGVQLLYVWPNVEPTIRTAFNTVAATFNAPPEPEGWPEGFSLAAVEMTPIGDPSREWLARVEWQRKARFCVYGSTREEAENLARLIAWTIANQRPVPRRDDDGPDAMEFATAYLGKFARVERLIDPTKAAVKSLDSVAEVLTKAGIGACDSYAQAVQQLVKQRDEAAGGISRQVYEDLKSSLEGPGGYREQIAALKSTVQDATSARLCLASHLTPTVRRALRPGLLEILASTGSCSPAEVDEALDDADKMAALLSRVRAVGEF